MPYAQLPHGNTYYEIHGEGVPLVLIAGLSCDLCMWAGILNKLTPHFKVITFDNRCVGRTETENTQFTIDDFADDTAALLKFLNIKKAHILGHSMGGCISQSLAARHPEVVDKLIILNSLVHITMIALRTFDGLLYLRRKYKIDVAELTYAMAPWTFSENFLSNADNIKGAAELSKLHAHVQSADNFEHQLHALTAFDGNTLATQIKQKTLVISGSADLLAPAHLMQEFAEKIKATYIEQAGMGHLTPIETPDWLSEQITHFLG